MVLSVTVSAAFSRGPRFSPRIPAVRLPFAADADVDQEPGQHADAIRHVEREVAARGGTGNR